ncbi:MAG: hypothetical protein ACRD0I_04670, partial [Acidimicrobiales bacterium]
MRARLRERGLIRRTSAIAGIVAMMAALVVPVLSASSAFASTTSVTPGSVTLSTTTEGATSTYTIQMTLSATGALGTNSTITLVAPKGTTFLPTAAGNYIVNSSSVSAVARSMVNSSTTNNKVVITLGASSLANSASVTITAIGVTNPTTASTTYSLSESTSADTVPATSSNYTVTPGPASQVVFT